MKPIQLSLSVIVLYLLASCSPKQRLSRLIQPAKDTALATAHTGICIYDGETGKVLFAQNADKQFIPASNMKLLTAYAVMKHLPDSLPGWYIHETADTLYLKPNGDPSFLHPDFPEQKVLALLKRNTKPVVLVMPTPAFNQRGFGWAWNNFQEFYMPERSVMPIYGNVVRFKKEGNDIQAIPAWFQQKLSSALSDPQKNVTVRRNENENQFTAISTSANYLTRPFTQKDNPGLTYLLLADTLARLGIAKPMVSASVPDFLFQPLYTQHTDSVLQFMMFNSDNFFAEQLLLMTGSQLSGTLNDRPTIDKLLREEYALPGNPRWVDGSGLSRNNHVTPMAFVTLLRKMKAELPWQRLSTILPNGGMGTLKGLYPGYERNIFAKTGTLNGQSALSGYLITKKGKTLIFSFLVNNFQSQAGDVRKAIAQTLTNIIDQY